jgi:hypothetical protein
MQLDPNDQWLSDTTVCVDRDELEMIEETFSRLNESALLTAPEKRNAYGGPLPGAIRKLAGEPFFVSNVPFPDRRYRHFDLATKFLYAENEGKVVDTKKAYLDKFVENFAALPRTKVLPFLKQAQDNVTRMGLVFTHKDPLLRQVGIVMLYFLVIFCTRPSPCANGIGGSAWPILTNDDKKTATLPRKAWRSRTMTSSNSTVTHTRPTMVTRSSFD